MAGRPHKMAERVDRLEQIAYTVLTRLEEAMPEMYKPGRHGPRGRPDTLARLWQRAASDMVEAYGSLLHLSAALHDKAEGQRVDPRDYHAHLDGDRRPGGFR